MKNLNEETNNKLGVQAKDQKKEIEELRAKHEELYEQLKKDKDEQIKILQSQLESRKTSGEEISQKMARMSLDYEGQI